MIPFLIRNSLGRRRLATALTTVSVALGVMLVVTVLLLRAQLNQHFSEPGRGYGLVVGPPASRLSLVLSAVYHLEPAPGLLPVSVYRELTTHPSSRLVVPLAVGDSFRGFPVVGTTDAFFNPHMPFPHGKSAQAKLAEGRPFRFDQAELDEVFAELGGEEHSHHHSHEHVLEAVVGSEVARRLGVRVGDRIEPTHGTEGVAHDHQLLWTVVGILHPTGTAVDRLVLIELGSFYQVAEHAEGSLVPGGGESGGKEPGISAVLVFPKGGMHKALLLTRLRKRADLAVAEVDTEIRKLMSIVGDVNSLLLLVAALATFIGLGSILVSIYNTMSERQREFAILRAVGVRRATLLLTVMAEATVLAVVGALVGLVLAHALVGLTAGSIEAFAGIRPSAFRPILAELWVLVTVAVGGALAGLLPAWQAYRTQVAANLAPSG